MPAKLVGVGPAILELLEEVQLAAKSDAKVLISGETGVGKEVVAQMVHQGSHRRNGPLVAVNCAGLPDSLLESELFGYVRGSFTGAYRDKAGLLESAHGGTIFLDEVGEMSLRMQAVLLRFLETGEIQRVGADRPSTAVDVRVIAATNRNLSEWMAAKGFREDLYYRLNVIHLVVPPLRERREDIPSLLEDFCRIHGGPNGGPNGGTVLQFSSEAMALIMAHNWPGNVRELKNVVERLIARVSGRPVLPADLPRAIRAPHSLPVGADAGREQKESLADVLWRRLVQDGESFWSAVYPVFASHDMTREDLRILIRRGLEQSRGSYRLLTQLFNMEPGEYKRFLNFLRQHGCHEPFQHFRRLTARHKGETLRSRPPADRARQSG